MKTKIILLILFIGITVFSWGQIPTKYFPNKNAAQTLKYIQKHSKSAKIFKCPKFDVKAMLKEDEANKGLDIPYRFGKDFDTQITLNDGEWSDLENGMRLWSMEFVSDSAYSINFVFSKLQLSPNAELYIMNSDQSVIYGPVISDQNIQSGVFLTDLIPGDSVTIYLSEPIESKDKSKFEISKVVHAYRQSSNMAYGNFGGSEACNNDIACYSDWSNESDAVALVLLASGNELCSGSLLTTADQRFRPFFLTAFHCIDSDENGSLSSGEITNAQSWMFKFQYKKASCNGAYATTGITYNGATFRAAYFNSDFALMELSNKSLDNSLTLLGWDRSTATPTSGVCIHHPACDVMKISFENNPFQISSWNGTNNHWLVNFDNGVVQPGSSGAPLFNQGRRVVGQLHGNQAYDQNKTYCQQPRAEYGRFDVSWTGGGTDATRLSNWLDPSNTGATTTNTIRFPSISGPSIICPYSGGTYTIVGKTNNDPITWTNSGNFSITGTSGNSATIYTTATSPQVATIIASFSGISVRKNIYIIQNPTPEYHGALGTYTNNQFTITPETPDIIKYRWEISPSTGYVLSNAYGLSLNVKFTQPGTYLIYAYGVSYCCESSSPTHIYNCIVSSPTGYSSAMPATITAYPIPASDMLNVEISEYSAHQESTENIVTPVIIDTDEGAETTFVVTDGTQSKVTNPNPTFDIHLYNGYGTRLRQATAKRGGKIQFNVHNLPNGTYYLHIYDESNGTVEKRQIIVKH